MENRQDDLETQLNGEYGKPGLIQQMQSFFAVQESRDKNLPFKVAVLAIIIPLIYDAGKHFLGIK